MKKHQVAARVLVTAMLLSCSLLTLGQDRRIAKCPAGRLPTHAPKYRIGSVRRGSDAGSPLLLLQISVSPEYFNRNDMPVLAQRLREDFCREKNINVAISDDYKAAKEGALIHDLLVGEPNAALRGFYDLNRATGKEGISFSTQRGKPLTEVTIELNSKSITQPLVKGARD